MNVDRNIIALLFPIVLFSSYGITGTNTSRISEHELHFMQLLHNHILQQAKGDHGLAAKKMGVANEIKLGLEEV